MSIYSVKLIKQQQVAEGTMAFFFKRPAGFDFGGGQSVDMTLINPPETGVKVDLKNKHAI
jgi:ferredoxin-NADP reductase